MIEHVFVLMLENRSFDHMLGFSGLQGTDPSTGQATDPGEVSEQSLEETLVGFLHIAMLRDAHLAAIEGTNLLTAIETKVRDLVPVLEQVGSKFHVVKYMRDVERRYEAWRGRAPAV